MLRTLTLRLQPRIIGTELILPCLAPSLPLAKHRHILASHQAAYKPHLAASQRPEVRRMGVSEYEDGSQRQSALMMAAGITHARFGVSSAMSLAKSAGEHGSTVPPRLASCALSLGSAWPALISL